jgi:hypothetical protein
VARVVVTVDAEVFYRKLKSGGYQLTRDLHFSSPSIAGCAARVPKYIDLGQDGGGVLRAGYWSDGMSGPLGELDDTKNTFAGAYVHDGLYQLGRGGHLPNGWRGLCDDIFEEICRQRGMAWPRRRFLRLVLWLRGRGSWKRQPEVEDTELSA